MSQYSLVETQQPQNPQSVKRVTNQGTVSDLSELEEVLTVSIQTQTPHVKSVDKAVGSINELK